MAHLVLATTALLLLLATQCTGEDSPVYNYDHGGSDWPGVCTSGNNQSPINIVTDYVKKGGNGRYMKLAHVKSSTMLLKNTNLSVPYTLMIYPTNNDSLLFLPDGTYYLHHLSLHTPANHPVNGMYAPLEVKHAYFNKENSTRKAVVVTMFVFDKDGKDNTWLNTILDNIPSKPGNVTVNYDTDYLEVMDLGSKGYWYYQGSQIHPPCNESVQFHISRSPSSLSPAQLLRYQNFLADMNHGDRTNNRALQPTVGQVVTQYSYNDNNGGSGSGAIRSQGMTSNQAVHVSDDHDDDNNEHHDSGDGDDHHDDDDDDDDGDHDSGENNHDDDHDDNHDDDHDDDHDHDGHDD